MKYKKKYKNEPKFNGVYSWNDLPIIKGGACIKNLDEYELIGTHWISLCVNVKYFDSFWVEHIAKEIRKFIRNKSIITNTCRTQAYDSTMCGYFYIGLIDFMLKGKILLAYTVYFFLMIMKRIIILY